MEDRCPKKPILSWIRFGVAASAALVLLGVGNDYSHFHGREGLAPLTYVAASIALIAAAIAARSADGR